MNIRRILMAAVLLAGALSSARAQTLGRPLEACPATAAEQDRLAVGKAATEALQAMESWAKLLAFHRTNCSYATFYPQFLHEGQPYTAITIRDQDKVKFLKALARYFVVEQAVESAVSGARARTPSLFQGMGSSFSLRGNGEHPWGGMDEAARWVALNLDGVKDFIVKARDNDPFDRVEPMSTCYYGDDFPDSEFAQSVSGYRDAARAFYQRLAQWGTCSQIQEEKLEARKQAEEARRFDALEKAVVSEVDQLKKETGPAPADGASRQ